MKKTKFVIELDEMSANLLRACALYDEMPPEIWAAKAVRGDMAATLHQIEGHLEEMTETNAEV